MLNPATPFRVALRERNIRLLLAGLATSQAGDWLYNLALLVLVYDRTHSSMWVGLTTAARILPEVILGPVGGVLIDRVNRRRLMIGSDAARAAVMALLAVVAVTNAPIALAPVLAALCTAAGSAYPQLVLAVLPRLANEKQLPAANAARVSITHVCIIAGPLFGAVLLFLGSPATAFLINGLTFAGGAVAIAMLPREALRRPSSARTEQYTGIAGELRTGWRALRGYGDAMALVGADIIASAVYGAFTVLLVLLARRLGAGAGGYGYLLAGLGAGGVLATGLANRAAAAHRPRRALALSVAALGVPVPILAIAGAMPVAVALTAVFGAGSIVLEVVADTCLQRSLDPAVFARAYGLVVPACVAGIAGGALLAPLSVELLGLNGTFVLIGAAVIAYCALLARPQRAQAAMARGLALSTGHGGM
jgi:predicted MFS family arabinose efflux permease